MSEKRIIFTKPYERDFTLAIEEYWARGFLDVLLPRLGLTSPFEIFEIFYVTEENMQIWENEAAIQWIQDELLARVNANHAFLDPYIAEYMALLAPLETFWHQGATNNLSKIKEYSELIRVAAPLFSMWYYPCIDDRIPEDVLIRLKEIRRTDEFFASNDTFIKDCIEKLGAEPRLGNLVYADEFPNIPSMQVLKMRAAGVVGIDGRQQLVMTLEAYAKQHPEYEFVGLFDKVPEVNEVKGQVAQKGMATGTVRIVKNKRQMLDVKDGDILVSPMTTPDFLSAMKKAAAFVTDEGGIMCHAAIVAREMKKPCVIGTKFATQIFKDGDLIEVDAEQGIIRKL